MPVRATAVIRILSTTAGVVTCLVLRKRLSLPASRVIRDDVDVCTVYINLIAPGQPLTRIGPASIAERPDRSRRSDESASASSARQITTSTSLGDKALNSGYGRRMAWSGSMRRFVAGKA